ncbi:MAG: hypothetical protein AAFU49_14275 [Pseudomonadota bacterium]
MLHIRETAMTMAHAARVAVRGPLAFPPALTSRSLDPGRLGTGQAHRRGLMEIAEDRDQAGGPHITGQLPVGAWHAINAFEDPPSGGTRPPSPMPSWIA